MLQPTADHVPSLAPQRPFWRQLCAHVLAAVLPGTRVGMLAPETGASLTARAAVTIVMSA